MAVQGDSRGAKTSSEDKWTPARLIPTSGIKGVDEQERRATSALLSVMSAVPEFSRSLLRKTGAPAGQLRSYIETPFASKDGGKIRPDGALIVRRGANEWKAFVEVKTGTNELGREQVEKYLDLARDEGFDAVITISNQMNTAWENIPLSVDKRKVKKVGLHHFSWVEVLSEAMIQRQFRGVSDPDQAWILDELIAYLQHPQSGAMEFQDMGPHWVTIREQAREGGLRPGDPGVLDVVTRWDQFMQYLSLFLTRDLDRKVSHVLPRREMDPSVRRGTLAKGLTESGVLSGTLRVQRAIGDITLSANLRARTVTVSVEVQGPADGRPLTRVNWLLRQLGETTIDTRIDAHYPGNRFPITRKLSEVREDPRLLLTDDKQKSPRTFVLASMSDMGSKRAGTHGSFIGQASDQLLRFYRDVVQRLKPWTGAAPKLPESRPTEDVATQRESVVEEVARQQAEEATQND